MHLCVNTCFDVYKAGNDREIWVHKVTDDLMSGWNSKPEGFTVHMNSDTKLKFWCETMFGRVIQVELLVFDH